MYLVFDAAGAVLGGKRDGREVDPGRGVASSCLNESYRA